MPIETFDLSNNPIINTDQMEQGVCVGTVSAARGTSATKQYPSLVGMKIYAMSSNSGSDATDLNVTYPGGVPTVTMSPAGAYGQFATIWAYGTRSVEPTSGVWATTPGGTMAIGPESHGLHYSGRATFVRHLPNFGDRNYGTMGHTELYFDSPTPPTVVARIQPNQFVGVMGVAAHPSVPGRWQIFARTFVDAPYPQWPVLQEPVLYCFTKRIFATEPAGSLLIYDADSGAINWSLSEPNLLYPLRLAEVALGYSTPVPLGVSLGVCGMPKGYEITVINDESSFPPQWHRDFFHYPHWWLDSSGQNLHSKLVLWDAQPESYDGQGTPVYEGGISHAIVINVGGL